MKLRHIGISLKRNKNKNMQYISAFIQREKIRTSLKLHSKKNSRLYKKTLKSFIHKQKIQSKCTYFHKFCKNCSKKLTAWSKFCKKQLPKCVALFRSQILKKVGFLVIIL